MATTANYTFNLPTVGGNEDSWGTLLNANWTALDTLLGGVTATEIAKLDGLTVTTDELNILDGVTATPTELNILDGVTATTAELNYVDGVTSGIQAQLNNKYQATTQSSGVWEAGTGTTESLVSPAKIKAAVEALAPAQPTTHGAVGTYALLNYNSSSPPTLSAGDTTAGSNLRYAGAVTANYSGSSGPTANFGGSPSGTWRIVGNLNMAGDSKINNASLYLRIS